MNKTMQRVGWGLSVTTVAFAGAVFAADDSAGSATERQQIQNQAGTQQPGQNEPGQNDRLHAARSGEKHEVIVRRLSDFSPADVRNEGDENLGRIQDVVVDARNGRVVYAVLSFGGFLGAGDKHFAVPFSAMKSKISHEDTDDLSYVLNVDKNRLQQARGFDKGEWPNMADRTWARETHQFWSARPYWEQDRAGTDVVVRAGEEGVDVDVDVRDRDQAVIEGEPISPEQPGRRMGTGGLLLKGEHLVGHKVLDQNGEEFAELEEVMADPNTGRLVYAIIQIDKAPDFSKDYMHAVPWKALNIRPAREGATGQGQARQDRPVQEGQIREGQPARADRSGGQLLQDEDAFQVVLNVSRDKLQQGPKFGEREWPSMTMQWGEQVYNHYGVQPFWKSGQQGQQRNQGQ